MNNPTEAVTPANPKHYRMYSIEPIEVCNSWGLNYNLGNVIKYIARMGKKRGHSALEDLQKARSYIDHEIERVTLYGHNSHLTGQEHDGDARVQVRDESDAINSPSGK